VPREPTSKLLFSFVFTRLFLRLDTLEVAPRRGKDATTVWHLQASTKSRQTSRSRTGRIGFWL